jgi:esterase/lipase superfamily enzyme
LKKPKDKNTIKNHLKLIPYQKNDDKGKTILILISGYFSSNDDHFKEWNELIKVYKKKFRNSIIYFFNWPSSEIKLSKIFYHQKDFKDARERGRYCGRLLALMIMSNCFFNGLKINLAAFSLGNHVIKHCIKEIEKFGRFDILNNIIFIAGATDIKCNFKWEHRLSSIKGAIINCYSNVDLALGYCKIITGKDTIGTKELKFKNVKNYLISSIHILYRINMDIIGKLFIDDLKE